MRTCDAGHSTGTYIYGAREPNVAAYRGLVADFGGPEGPRIDPWTLNVDRTLRRSPVMCVVGERDEAGDGLSVDGSVHTMRPPKRWTVRPQVRSSHSGYVNSDTRRGGGGSSGDVLVTRHPAASCPREGVWELPSRRMGA